ncbi:hypothetical protein PR048_017657 [Dryococelus australis]|uniref:Reverse transcriptase/retrotransposon-derived protein RNase H-like domain-containing protein n=1 Tax=Dryococelus australis TaxID=614101 RepID=A0ABQ9HA80_9NEOP|nr:hypothetical protein PR048_017657 [Dryococelus australis]
MCLSCPEQLNPGARISQPQHNVQQWSTVEQETFVQFKTIFLEEHIIKYAVQGQEFFLYTDASDLALGCRLARLDSQGTNKPVPMASRTKIVCLPDSVNVLVWSKKGPREFVVAGHAIVSGNPDSKSPQLLSNIRDQQQQNEFCNKIVPKLAMVTQEHNSANRNLMTTGKLLFRNQFRFQ